MILGIKLLSMLNDALPSPIIGERERANLVVQLARYLFAVRRDVALMPYVLPISKYTTVFLNIRGTKFCITRLSASSWATRSCQRSKRSCRLAACRLSTCSCRLSTCMIFHICPYVAMSLSCRMFYLFRRFCPVMPRRNTKFCITRLSASSWAMPAVQAFMQAINVFMQAVNAFMQYVNTFMQAASSFRPPGVVWDLQYALY